MRGKITGFILIVLFILNLSACKKNTTEYKPPVAILGAFEDEIILLADSINGKEVLQVEGIRFTQGILEGKKVVIAYTGIGKVNAAMSTAILISHFHPSEVIFTGIAGGLNPSLNPSDIVLGREVVQHDLNFIYDDSLVSYQPSSPITEIKNPVFFSSDSVLLSLAEEAAKQVKLELYPIEGMDYNPKIITGIIATGDAFIASRIKKEALIKRFHADAVEMEGAAVAQVCYQYKIPFIIIRSISDSADQNADMDIEKFLKVAATNANRLVIRLIMLME
jgi:adenosylhomocysteine nucleosidase